MKKYLKYLLHAVILVGLVVAAVKYLNGEEILNALRTYHYGYAPLVLALSTAYILSKAWRFVVLMSPISNTPWSVTVRAYVAGTAATLLPGGIAVRAGLMHQAGVPVEKSSAPVAYSSILDQGVFVIGLLIAALGFEPVRVPALILIGVLAVAALVFLIPTTRNLLARAAEWVARKFNVLEKWREFLASMAELAEPRLLGESLLITFGGLAMQVMILDLTLQGFGEQVPYSALFLAYIVPTMLGRISAIPAGVGVTEAGMVGFLAAMAQMDIETAAAAAAIFRIATVFFQALLGALVYFFAWRGEAETEGRQAEQGPRSGLAGFRKSIKSDPDG